jgi:integrase/recombinase XerD
METFTSYLTRRRYRSNTIKAYTELVRQFLRVLGKHDPSALGEQDIARYIQKYYVDAGRSSSYQNQAVNALKLYYKVEFGKDIGLTVALRPRGEHKLPNVLSTDDVKRLLQSFDNEKHRTIFYLIYSGGMRISEAVNMRLTDIDSKRGMIRIRDAKGGKDREVPLSKTLFEQIRSYYKVYKPKEWLFEGQFGGQYTTRSIQALFRQAIERTGIKKKATVHTLRHSYATHLLENGTDLRIIQELLGHKSSKTTDSKRSEEPRSAIYTHVSQRLKQNVPNPLDQLGL